MYQSTDIKLLEQSNMSSNAIAAEHCSHLALCRRPGESLIIGGNIRICILNIRGRQVNIRISAPRRILVDRQEIFLRRLAEKMSIEDIQKLMMLKFETNCYDVP